MTKIINRSAALFLLMLVSIPLALLIVQTFSLEVDPSLPYWLAGLCVILWFGSFGRLRFFISMGLSLMLILGAFYLYSEDLTQEFGVLISQIHDVYYNYLTGVSIDATQGQLPSTALVLLVFFVIIYYLSQTLLASRGRIALTMLGYLPLFLCCAAVNGHMKPNLVFAVILFTILLISGGNMYQEEGERGMVTWTVAIPASLLLMVCLMIADPPNYRFDEEDINRSRRFDQLSKVFSEMLEREPVDPPKETVEPTAEPKDPIDYGNSSWSNKNGEMNMGSAYFNNSEQLLLSVKADYTGCMYLRRCSFGDYAGTKWLTDAGEAPVSSLSFTAAAAQQAGFPLSEINIRQEKTSDLLLVPYFSPAGADNDAYVPSDGASEYSLSYYPCGNAIYGCRLSGEEAELEREYRDYAYETYTALPENTEFSAQYILREAGISPDDENLIWEIASYVQQSGVYNINTSPSQSGDLAIYFLTQSHKGYCIHFASAAAVLYRAAGIPARVAGGYMFNVKAGEYVGVYARNEHAWVEIYAEGLGWIPIETTAQDLSGSGDLEPSPISPFSPDSEASGLGPGQPAATQAPVQVKRPDATPRPSLPPAPTPLPTRIPVVTPEASPAASASPSAAPSPSPVPSASPVPEAAPSASPEPSSEPAATDVPASASPDEDSSSSETASAGEETESKKLSPWATLFLLPPAVFLTRQLRLLHRKRRIAGPDNRKSAIAMWKEARFLCRSEAYIPNEIRSAAERAAFSRSAPNKTEMQEANRALRRLESKAFLDSHGLRHVQLILRGRLFR